MTSSGRYTEKIATRSLVYLLRHTVIPLQSVKVTLILLANFIVNCGIHESLTLRMKLTALMCHYLICALNITQAVSKHFSLINYTVFQQKFFPIRIRKIPLLCFVFRIVLVAVA